MGLNKVEKDLSRIYKELGKMTSLVNEAISNTTISLSKRDVVLADKVIENDKEIDDLEVKIDQECVLFIAKNQPVASDLRVIASIHKILTDLKRIGDITRDICRYVKLIYNFQPSSIDKEIIDLANNVKNMLNKAIRSFINRDVELAYEVIKFDDVIDETHHKIREVLIIEMEKDESKGYIKEYVYLLLINKYLEKIADHSHNISEWIIYNVRGEYISE